MGVKLLEICVTGEQKLRKKPRPGNFPDRGWNPGPLHDRRACYRQLHSGGFFRNHKTRLNENGGIITIVIMTRNMG